MTYKVHLINLIKVLMLLPLPTGQVWYRKCYTPHGTYLGNCIQLEKCPPLKKISIMETRSRNTYMYLRQSEAICSTGIKPKVCCPPRDKWRRIKMKSVNLPTMRTIKPFTTTTTTPQPRTTTTETTTTAKILPKTATNISKASLFNRILNGPCGQSPPGTRIFGGTAAQINQYPWMALLYAGNDYLCGASLITSQFLLTAAHCFISTSGEPNIVHLSEYNITSFPTDNVETDGGGTENITVTVAYVQCRFIHPGYDMNSVDMENDIALIKLAERVQYTEYINPICLPVQDYVSEFTPATRLIVAGWGADGSGYTTSEIKKHVRLPYANCTSPLERVICAGGESGRDSCEGDSGGPLMYDTGEGIVIVGVVRSGQAFVKCGSPGRPGMYTYVYKYMDWIEKTVRENEGDTCY